MYYYETDVIANYTNEANALVLHNFQIYCI